MTNKEKAMRLLPASIRDFILKHEANEYGIYEIDVTSISVKEKMRWIQELQVLLEAQMDGDKEYTTICFENDFLHVTFFSYSDYIKLNQSFLEQIHLLQVIFEEDEKEDVELIKLDNTKRKIEIELFRYKTLVFGKILYQSESLRCIINTSEIVLSENTKFRIKSKNYPHISFNTLYVKGTEEKRDNDILYYDFSSVQEAIEYCFNIKKLIDKINAETFSVEEEQIERMI